jgi:tetratricopeptide (TPR) repeat protein
MKNIRLKKATKKSNIQQRILRANVVLILIPMIILAIVTFIQIGALGQLIGEQGTDSIEAQGLLSLQNKSGDNADYVDNFLGQLSVDLDRIASYNRDLFENKINITNTRNSYHQNGIPTLPTLAYSSRYNRGINTSYSDYVNITTINAKVESLINKSAYMDYIFEPVYKSNALYVTIFAGYEDGFSRQFPFIDNSRPVNQNVSIEEWYFSAKNLNGTVSYTVNQSIVGPSIILSKAVKYENGTLIGCVCIEFELSSLRDLIGAIKVQRTGYITLIDNSGNALIHPGLMSMELYKDFAQLEINSGEFQAILSKIKSGQMGIDTFSKGGTKWVIAYNPVGKGGYSIASLVPESEITESGNILEQSIAIANGFMILILIIVLIALFCVIIFAVLRVSKRITQPIKQLTSSIDNMVRGDLSQEIAMDKRYKKNEIGVLAQSFQALLVTMRLGNQSYYQGDTFLAYKNYAAALELFKTTNNIKGQGICWNNLGNIFRTWAEFDKAKEAYDESIKIATSINDRVGLSSRLNNRGLLFLSEENWDAALMDFNDAINLDEETQSDDRVAIRKRNLGVLYLLRKDHQKAQNYLGEALKIDKELSSKTALAEDHFQLGRLALEQNNIESALEHFEMSLQIAEEFGNNPLMMNILRILVKIYDDQDDTVKLHKSEAKLAKVSDKIVRKKDVIFVIDQSGSMFEQSKMRAARRGEKEVFETVINPNDRVAIIGFHSLVSHVLPLTLKSGNVKKVQEIFKNLRETQYQTAFYDAVGQAIDMLKDSPNENQKWVVALTDGLDNCSKRFNSASLAKYITKIPFPMNIILIGVGRELREVYYDMNLIVNSSLRGKYIPIYSEAQLAKLIEDAFKRVKEIMASSEIEGFSPEEK